MSAPNNPPRKGAVRVLYGVFLIVPCTWKRIGRFHLGSLQTGYLLCTCDVDSSCTLGINGILYVQPIADVLSAIITVLMALHLHKELVLTKQKFLIDKVE